MDSGNSEESITVKSNSSEGDDHDSIKCNNKEKHLGSNKLTNMGSFRDKAQFLRADKIDLKTIDTQLEKLMTYSRSSSLESEIGKQKEVWEIDLSKLDIKHVIGQGTYGTVFRGVYDGQYVAGTNIVHCTNSATNENFKSCEVHQISEIVLVKSW